MGLFVLPCGVLRASGACGFALGYHGQLLCFPWSVPVPETHFSVKLGLCPCSLHAVGGYGRWFLSFPSVAGHWLCSESSFPAPYPTGRGDQSGKFPLSGEVFPSDTACYALGQR
jgi:hypothetical protein